MRDRLVPGDAHGAPEAFGFRYVSVHHITKKKSSLPLGLVGVDGVRIFNSPNVDEFSAACGPNDPCRAVNCFVVRGPCSFPPGHFRLQVVSPYD